MRLKKRQRVPSATTTTTTRKVPTTAALVLSMCLCRALFLPNGYTYTSRRLHELIGGSKNEIDVTATSSISNKDERELECLRQTLQNLPIGKGRLIKRRNPNGYNIAHAHHWDAGDAKRFNQEMRLTPIPYLDTIPNCTVWEVGAHVRAGDSQDLQKSHPNCIFHAYEPVPHFYKQLQTNLAHDPKHFVPHNYGLANETLDFPIYESDMADQATFLSGTASGGQKNDVTTFGHLRSFAEAANEAGRQPPTMMHINCEGCEWTMMPQLLQESEFLSRIPFLQINFHNYGATLGERVLEYCAITVALEDTHEPVSRVPFGWERWKRKDV